MYLQYGVLYLILTRPKFVWATMAAKAEQKSLVLAQQALSRKDPFLLYSLTPHSPQFQQSAGATHF
jgi:hypothetical protein